MQMRTVWIVVVIVFEANVLGCTAKQESAGTEASKTDSTDSAEATDVRTELGLTGTLSAKVIKLDGREVPENTVLKLELRHLVDPSSREAELLTAKSVNLSTLPAVVALPYDISKIQKRELYFVNASILQGEKLLYGTDAEIGVLTFGKGERADVVLRPANLLRER
jgi:uncharacterized lipoprotein YbaY